jgi:hypothetical protein
MIVCNPMIDKSLRNHGRMSVRSGGDYSDSLDSSLSKDTFDVVTNISSTLSCQSIL